MTTEEPTTAETIKALGGVRAVARHLGVGTAAVHNWRYFGVFPPRHYLLLAELAEEKKVFLDRNLFQERVGGKARGEEMAAQREG